MTTSTPTAPTAAVQATWNCPRENVRRTLADARRYRDQGAIITNEHAASIKAMFAHRRLPLITPATVRVGLGATYCLWSDSHACEVIAVSKTGRKVTVRQLKATLSPAFKPDFIPGGFVGHVANQDDQKWTLESDPNGAVTVVNWSPKRNRFEHGGRGGCRLWVHAVGQGHEHHDFNF